MKKDKKKGIMMEQGLNKQKTKAVYGVAVLMMIYHHLFCLPNRLDYNYTPILYINGINIEQILAWFCKICVAMYAFITGYGLIKISNKYKKNNPIGRIVNCYKIIIKQAVKFFSKFWLVCLFFLPIGFTILGNKFEIEEFIYNIIGINNSYNQEWWYIFQYLKMLLIFPIIDFWLEEIFQKNNKKRKLIFITIQIICCIFIEKNQKISTFALVLYEFLGPYTLVFLVGNIFAKLDIFLKIKKAIDKRHFSRKLFAIILLQIVIYGRMKSTVSELDMKYDYIFVPFFILAIELLVNEKGKIGKTLISFGKRSTYIWLLHTFFCYYYFKEYILMAKYSILIYLVVTLLSYISALIIDKVYRILKYISLIKVKIYVKPIINISRLNQILQVAETVEGKIRIEK